MRYQRLSTLTQVPCELEHLLQGGPHADLSGTSGIFMFMHRFVGCAMPPKKQPAFLIP